MAVIEDIPVLKSVICAYVALNGFGETQFSPSSQTGVDVLRALVYARAQGMSLQSANIAIIVRDLFYEKNKQDNQGLDNSDLYQITRTIALSYKKDGKIITGFTELENDNETLKFLSEVCNDKPATEELLLPASNPYVAALIAHMRVVPALDNQILTLSTKQKNGVSEYGSHPYVRAMIGDAAERNAAYLSKLGMKTGTVRDKTQSELELLQEGQVLLRAVTIGGGEYFKQSELFAIDSLTSRYGKARAMIEK